MQMPYRDLCIKYTIYLSLSSIFHFYKFITKDDLKKHNHDSAINLLYFL